MFKTDSSLQPRSAQSRFMRLAARVLVALIFLMGLAVLIGWLILHPKKLVYSLEDAYITDYSLSRNHLNATYNFRVRARNPNKRASVYYDSTEVRVKYAEHIVATDMIEQFLQPKRNTTELYVKAESRDMHLSRHAAKTMRSDRTAGSVQLDLKILARVTFKVGVWKSKDRTMNIDCSQVATNWAKGLSFQRKFCDVHL